MCSTRSVQLTAWAALTRKQAAAIFQRFILHLFRPNSNTTNRGKISMSRPSFVQTCKRAGKALGQAGNIACQGVYMVGGILVCACGGACIWAACVYFRPNRHPGRSPDELRQPVRPSTRPRRLTMPLTERKGPQKTLDQLSSRLMKLPLEIRQMIYADVLGGYTIGLRISNGKLIAQRFHDCGEGSCIDCKLSQKSKRRSQIAILKTCRQM